MANVVQLFPPLPACPTVHSRIARLLEECCTPLGFAMRGMASWDQEDLFRWLDRDPLVLSAHELDALARMERQVFGSKEKGPGSPGL